MSALSGDLHRRMGQIGKLWPILIGALLVALSTPLPTPAAESSPAARAAYTSAAALQNREAWDLAAEEWQSLLTDHPDDPLAAKARYYLGICQLKLGDWPAAEKTLGQVTNGTADADTLAAARWELARGRFRAAQAAGTPQAFAAAAESLQRFLAQHPDHPEADSGEHLWGEATWQAGKRDEAVVIWRRFAKQYPQSKRLPEVLYALGVGLAELGRSAEAVAVFKQFASQFADHPLSPDVTIWQADSLSAAGRPAEAATLLQPLAAANGPRQLAALGRLADLQWREADWPAAAASYRQLATAETDRGRADQAMLSAAQAQANAGQAAAAVATLTPLLDRPTAATLDAAHLVATWQLQADRPAEALAAIDRGLANQPQRPAADSLAQLMLDRGDALWALPDRRDEAIVSYESLVTEHPDTPAAAAAVSMLALARLDAKQPAAALKQVERFRDRYAKTATAAAIRDIETIQAEALLETDKPAAAARLLTKLLAEHRDWSRREEAWLLLARAQREAGDVPAAINAVKQCLKEFPAGPQADLAWYRLGQLQQPDDVAAAIDAYAASVKAKPTGSLAAWSLLATGWCHEAAGDLTAAEQAWGTLIDRFPESTAAASAVLARGDVRQRLGEYAGGLADARQVLADDSAIAARLDAAARGEARLLEGLCLLGLKQYAAAAESLRTALSDTPNLPTADRVLFQLGIAESLSGDQAAASLTFKRLVEQFPQSPTAADAWLQLGEAEYAAASWSAAAKAYQQAIAAAPRLKAAGDLLEQAHHKLGWTQLMQDKPGLAAAAFAAQLDAAPTGPLAADARALRAQALAADGQQAAALAAFKTALADPVQLSSPELQAASFIRAAETAAAAKEWKESLAFAERLLALDPKSSQANAARYAAGWARQNLGQLDRAVADYRLVAEADRSELAARARFMEGEVLFEQGQHKEAIKTFFKVAYGFGETDAPAAYQLWQAQATYEAARCFEVLKRPEQAEKLYTELLQRYPDCEQAPTARRRLDALTVQQAPAGEPTQ